MDAADAKMKVVVAARSYDDSLSKRHAERADWNSTRASLFRLRRTFHGESIRDANIVAEKET